MSLGENPTTDYPLVCDKGCYLNGFKLSKKKKQSAFRNQRNVICDEIRSLFKLKQYRNFFDTILLWWNMLWFLSLDFLYYYGPDLQLLKN